MKREWKVGERCWAFDDERAQRGTISEFDKFSGCYRVDLDASLSGQAWAWRRSTAIFRTRLDALIDDASALVSVRRSNHGWAVYDAKVVNRRVKQTARDLEKAKKRLAALRAKVKP